jgi:phytol kinase
LTFVPIAPVPVSPQITVWWGQQLAGIVVVIAWLALLSVLALLVRSRWPTQPEWSRKVIHIGSGAVVPIAWAMGIDRLIAIPAAGLVTLLAALNHRLRVLPAVEDVDRRSYGTIAYGASITLMLLLWWPLQPATVTAGVLVMALGDGLAGLLGPLIASPSWQVLGQRRSVVGTGVMAFVSLAVLFGLASLTSPSHAVPTVRVMLAIALLAVLLEQVATWGIDNLTVPLATAWLWNLSTPAGGA